MKKLVCLLVVMGLALVVGCAKQEPEEVAKAFVDQQIAKHGGFVLDTSRLTYKVTVQDEESAVVAVSGNIPVQGEVPLVKKDGKWVVGVKTAQAAPAAGHQPKKEEAPKGH